VRWADLSPYTGVIGSSALMGAMLAVHAIVRRRRCLFTRHPVTLLPRGRGACDHRPVSRPKGERTLYEIASSFFAAVVILFAAVGMVVTAFGEDGVGSAGFLVCSALLMLGFGRLLLGLKRGNEGGEEL